jgi:hypothetical protein
MEQILDLYNRGLKLSAKDEFLNTKNETKQEVLNYYYLNNINDAFYFFLLA